MWPFSTKWVWSPQHHFLSFSVLLNVIFELILMVKFFFRFLQNCKIHGKFLFQVLLFFSYKSLFLFSEYLRIIQWDFRQFPCWRVTFDFNGLPHQLPIKKTVENPIKTQVRWSKKTKHRFLNIWPADHEICAWFIVLTVTFIKNSDRNLASTIKTYTQRPNFSCTFLEI